MFPVQQQPNNWDFMVFAHETGHNFNSPHTHDWCPTPLDECASSNYFGSCQTQQNCTNMGTIMSYCHLCSGGTANITTFFQEPDVVGVMTAHAQACLPLGGASITPAAQPTLLAPEVPTNVDVTIVGTPTGTVDLNYRYDGGAFQVVAMSDQGGGAYQGTLPAAICTDQPEWYFSFTDAQCGPVQTASFFADVGIETVTFSDPMEDNAAGWTVGAGDDDATTGVWERGDPLGTEAQPSNDHTDPGGTDCWFTGQGSPGGSLGENDVDGGKTTLFSPVLDFSAGDSKVSYWRWYSNDKGSSPNNDVFVVDITNDGWATFQNVETVGPTGDGSNGGWFLHEFYVGDHVTPNATVQLRFIASDEGSGSIVEAAIDDFQVGDVDCTLCQPDLGFGGPGTTTLAICGDVLATGGSATLSITGAPASTPAWVVLGFNNNPTPLLGGTLVPVPSAVVVSTSTDGSGERHIPLAGGTGTVSVTLFCQALAFDNGQTELFQISNAIAADFQP